MLRLQVLIERETQRYRDIDTKPHMHTCTHAHTTTHAHKHTCRSNHTCTHPFVYLFVFSLGFEMMPFIFTCYLHYMSNASDDAVVGSAAGSRSRLHNQARKRPRLAERASSSSFASLAEQGPHMLTGIFSQPLALSLQDETKPLRTYDPVQGRRKCWRRSCGS
jgi:hypothetical protein